LVELYRRNCRPNTLRTHAVTIGCFLLYLKGSGREGLKAIDRPVIGGFVEQQQDLGLTANTISVRRGLYGFLKFWVSRGELSAEVLTRKLRIQLPKSLPRAIDPHAVRQMLSVIDHVRDRAIVLVLLRTGMRIGANHQIIWHRVSNYLNLYRVIHFSCESLSRRGEEAFTGKMGYLRNSQQ
jgi:site-specific recombinase XerC